MSDTHIGITHAGFKAWSRGPWLNIEHPGGLREIGLAAKALFVWPIDVGTVVAVAFKGHEGPIRDRAIVANSLGEFRIFDEPNIGNQSIGLRIGDGGDLRLVYTSATELLEYSLDIDTLTDFTNGPLKRTPLSSLMQGFPAEGFLGLNPDPVWTHLPESNPAKVAVIHGVKFFYPRRVGRFTVGLHDDLFGIVHDHQTGKTYRAWEGMSQIPPQISEDGTAVFSANADFTSLFVPASAYLGRPEKELTASQPTDPEEPTDPQDPDDPEEPEQPVAEFPLEDLKRERKRYGPYEGDNATVIGPNEAVDILNRTLWPHRAEWGLLKKESGNHGVRQEDGARCSVDYAIRLSDRMGGDVFGSAGSVDGKGPTTPQGWSAHEQFPEDRIVRAVKPADVPDQPDDPEEPDEPDQPIPQPVDLKPILDRLEHISLTVLDIHNQVQEQRRAIEALARAVAAMPAAKPFPEYEGHASIRVIGTAPIVLKPKG